jgi:PKD repeat protein
MKQLTKFATLVTSMVLFCQATLGNDFVANDLYLGFTQSSAQADYDIDLGQPGVVGVGGTSVVNLGGDFSLSIFNSNFSSGADGVLMSVVGGDPDIGSTDVYATQVRTKNFGNPAVAGSKISETELPQTVLAGAANEVAAILANTTSGLPTAGNYVEDSTKSYTAIVDTQGATTFIGKSGITPYGTIGSSNVIYMDLWQVLPSTKTNTYLGYFTFDVSGSTAKFTFTPLGAAAAAPVAGFSGTPTTGAAPLPVVFTDASTGSVTNWVWNFGNGISVTNTSSASVTNTYASAGSYTVTLTVTGPGGNNTLTKTSYIVVSSGVASVPRFNVVTISGGKLVISGTNGPVSAEFRILSSTNLISGTWKPVFTNNFLSNGGFAYTNSTLSGQAFFRVVSP